MEHHTDDTDFASDAFTAPSEVAGIETEGTEFAVAATGANEMDALGADTGVGRLTTFLDGSVLHIRNVKEADAFGLLQGDLTSSCGISRDGHQTRCAYGACHE